MPTTLPKKTFPSALLLENQTSVGAECLTFRQNGFNVLTVSDERQSVAVERTVAPVAKSVDGVQVLREVLELQKESDRTLDIDAEIAFGLANPSVEIVDSLGAVSVVCAMFGADTPKTLIPQHLLTHKNFSTFSGLQRVILEMERTHRV